MPAPVLSEQEFINLWRDLKSVAEMSRLTGLSERALYARRNRIEAKTGALLAASCPDKAVKHDPNVAKLITTSRRDVNRLELSNGVVLVGSDAHYSPGHISVAHKALCNLLTDIGSEVKAAILNGDLLDGGSISRHPRIRWRQQPSVKDELEAVLARTGEIEKAAPPGCKLLRTYGNHDARFESRLSAMVPQYEGLAGFMLRDHLPKWQDSDRIDINADTVVLHDWHSGVHSGWNDVLKGGGFNTVTGHTHEFSAKAHKGFGGTRYGIKTGMLADDFQPEFDYRLGKPGMNWQSGFVVLTWCDGMLLHPEFCAVRDDGCAYFRGKLYATP